MNRTSFLLAVVLGTSSLLLLVDSAIKGAAILVVATCVAMLLRRDSAAMRHLVWLLAIVAMLGLPVFSAMLPQWRVLPTWVRMSPEPFAVESPPLVVGRAGQPQVEVRPEQHVSLRVAEPPSASPANYEALAMAGHHPIGDVSASPPEVVAAEVIPEPAEPRWNRAHMLPLMWAIGFSAVMLRLMAARWMLWRCERRGTVIALRRKPRDASSAEKSSDPVVTEFDAACRKLGIRQPVRLLIQSERTIPVVWGVIRLRLLLPATARQWGVEQLHSVLLHELAHIKRRDTIAQLLAQIACGLHWFNPLVWFAAWRLHVERERACDDRVLASGVRASAYAEHLLNVVTCLPSSPWAQASGLAMARKSTLEGRLRAVLSEKLNRRGVSVALAAIAVAIGIGIAVPIAMLRAVGATAGETTVAADDDDAAPQGAVQHDSTAAFLLKQWQDLEGRMTPLSEATVAQLRLAVDKWMKQPAAQAKAARVRALRDWNIERAEHPVDEVAAWLDEIAAIHPGPLAFAISSETLVGPTLSAERQATLHFGPAAESGLRAAWSRYPARDTYLLGDVIDTHLVIQNVSDRTVEFECPHSVENIVAWEATTDDGRTIEAKAAPYAGTFPLFTWQLKPGAVAEIYGHGVVIGEGDQREDVKNPWVSTRTTLLKAKRGEHVTVHWKVREPVEMTTPDVSFQVVDLEDVPAWSTSRAGKWSLPGGVMMEVRQQLVHAADMSSTAILTWPTDKAGRTARHEIWLGADAFSNRRPWLLAWERGVRVLWTLSGAMQSPQDFRKVMPTPESLRRIDFSDPERITDSTWSYAPELLPDAIRAELARGFLPLPTKPRTPAYAKPAVQVYRAEDARPVSELLNGTWKSRTGYMDLRVIFPEMATDEVQWTMELDGKQGSATIHERLARINSPHENAVHLAKPRRQPRTPDRAWLGRLRRGIGDTLLLDIMPHVDFPEYARATGIELVRENAPQGEAERDAQPKRGAELPPGTE